MEPDVGSPAELSRPVENLFRTHRLHDVGVGADPYAGGGDLAEDGVDAVPILAAADRVDPDDDAVDAEELVADRRRDLVAVHHRPRVDADVGERVEHRSEPLI